MAGAHRGTRDARDLARTSRGRGLLRCRRCGWVSPFVRDHGQAHRLVHVDRATPARRSAPVQPRLACLLGAGAHLLPALAALLGQWRRRGSGRVRAPGRLSGRDGGLDTAAALVLRSLRLRGEPVPTSQSAILERPLDRARPGGVPVTLLRRPAVDERHLFAGASRDVVQGRPRRRRRRPSRPNAR